MSALLEAVHEEDRPIVRNVIAALQAIKPERVFNSWTVGINGPHYVVSGFIPDNVDYELGSRELELLYEVSPLRVISVSVGRFSGKHMVRVLVANRDQPLMLSETQVLHVRKRSRWMRAFGGGGEG